MGLTVSVFTPTPQFSNDLADVMRVFWGNIALKVNEGGGEAGHGIDVFSVLVDAGGHTDGMGERKPHPFYLEPFRGMTLIEEADDGIQEPHVLEHVQKRDFPVRFCRHAYLRLQITKIRFISLRRSRRCKRR